MNQMLGHRHEDAQMRSCSSYTTKCKELKIQLLKKIFRPHTDTILGYHPQVEVTTSEYPGSFLTNCNHALGQYLISTRSYLPR